MRSLRHLAVATLLSLVASLGFVGTVLPRVDATSTPAASITAPVLASMVGTTSVSPIGSVRWTTTTVNVRGHPTTANKPLFKLSAGTPVRVVRAIVDANKRTWFLVRVHSRLGWVAAWLTSATRPGQASASSTSATSGWQSVRATDYGIGDGLLGGHLACGGKLTTSVMAVAHRTLPCGTRVLIKMGGAVVTAQVLDRGPYTSGLTFDLGPAVCHALRCSGVFTIEWKLAK